MQHRRASLPWLWHHLQAQGWHVTVVTIGYSWLSRLLGDRRMEGVQPVPDVGLTVHSPLLSSVFGFAPIHPVSTRSPTLDALLEPVHHLHQRYWQPRLAPLLARADLVVLESGAPVLLAPDIRHYAPNATLVYKIADDIRALGLPRFVVEAEKRHAHLFDRISVASPVLAARFARLGPVRMDPLGVPRDILDAAGPAPAGLGSSGRINAVCAGTTLLDMSSLVRMARLRPDWRLHVIGRIRSKPRNAPDNLLLHGERPYAETAAWVRYANIGLAPYTDSPAVAYQATHSNRLLMYRYFGLPVIGPEQLQKAGHAALIGYSPGDDHSLARAMKTAEKTPRRPEHHTIPDWSEFARRIASTPRRTQTDPVEASDLQAFVDLSEQVAT